MRKVRVLSVRILGNEWAKKYIGKVVDVYYHFANWIGFVSKDGIVLLDEDEYEEVENDW